MNLKRKPKVKSIGVYRFICKNPLRVGVAGAGLMGRWHARAAEKAGGKVVAIADPEENQRNSLAMKYPAAQTFANVAEMLRRQPLDILHLCIPTADHYQIAEIALAAGTNILVEKPLAASTEETIKLYELAEKNKVRICPVHQFVFQQSVRKAQKILARLGPVIHLNAAICSAGGGASTLGKINETVLDILPHSLSLFQAFLHTLLIKENFSGWMPQTGELRIEGSMDSTSLAIFISLNSRPPVNSFQIFAEKGTLHLDLFHDFVFVERGRVSKMQKILRPFDLSIRNFSAAFFNLVRRTARSEPAYPGLQALVEEFYSAVSENKELPISSAQAINVAQVRDQMICSIEKDIQKYS